MDDTDMSGGDDLSMEPEIVVDLMSKLQDTNVILLITDRESDTDLPPPSAMVALEVNVTVEEISKLLQEFPSAKPPVLEAQSAGLAPNSGCPRTGRP